MSRRLWSVQTKWFDRPDRQGSWTTSEVPGETAREAVNPGSPALMGGIGSGRPPSLGPEERAELRNAWLSRTLEGWANWFGINRSVIVRTARRMGLPKRPIGRYGLK